MPRKSDVVYAAHPPLRQPRMVLALDGWVDGGEAATGSVRFLRRKLRPRKLAEIPAGRFHVYQVPGQLSLRPYTRVEEGLEGLIHVSELAEGSFMHPLNVINEGDHVRARVLAVDGVKRRIALTLRASDIPARGAGEAIS